MTAHAFDNAPQPAVVGGTVAVPIDIQSVHAAVVCDTTAATATATATMTFQLGDTAGRPLFDLRQPITSAMLDGAPIPVADLGSVTLNGSPADRMRRINRHLAAGSTHVLELSYSLGQPDAGGSQPLGWQTSPAGLSWDLWFSDLTAGRYLEMWLPSNLVYDTFDLTLDLQLTGAQTPHTLISNASTTTLGTHHWQLQWTGTKPYSPLLVLTPSSAVESSNPTVNVPGIGLMSLELHRHVGASTSMNALRAQVVSNLADFAQTIGPYPHGDRFTALLWTGTTRAMEYAGGTTTTIGALRHETFHSWFARGVLPARACDGWLDEAWTVYLADQGGNGTQPFSAGDPPVTLRYADRWRRDTPGASYSSGRRFFAGLADEIGAPALRQHMRDLYTAFVGKDVTTEDLAAHLVRATGRVDLLDFFHRYVYGHADPASPADLHLRDNPADTGTTPTSGVFWRSPDVWVRNRPDGLTSSQNPETGQDNWLYARVHNRSASTARLFGVTFAVKTWAGTQFVYPGDWTPMIAAAVGTDLGGGESRVMRARWPAGSIPATGTHGCILAQVYTPDDPASLGAHVWEHNNLAQRNITVVDLVPGDSVLLDTRLGSVFARLGGAHRLELHRIGGSGLLGVELAHPDPQVLQEAVGPQMGRPPEWEATRPAITLLDPARIEVPGPSGGVLHLNVASGSRVGTTLGVLPAVGASPTIRLDQKLATVPFGAGRVSTIPLHLTARRPLHAKLRVTVPRDARPGSVHELDLVQRDARGTVVGGVGVQVRVVAR